MARLHTFSLVRPSSVLASLLSKLMNDPEPTSERILVREVNAEYWIIAAKKSRTLIVALASVAFLVPFLPFLPSSVGAS